ncbi:hypothetical protein FOS14_22060 [Skermania sp. ID1734]|uniref:hypothetical protein n=1 Tax=Skermania sp. ID1734 TaxID=2597516 RepID=UPI00117E0B6D|nr:hypothetical protein [Skermania sp. ID1734]TSD93752.1 hypothetical protein FOS14_22060 [Skermania sp. ID1734]
MNTAGLRGPHSTATVAVPAWPHPDGGAWFAPPHRAQALAPWWALPDVLPGEDAASITPVPPPNATGRAAAAAEATAAVRDCDPRHRLG